MGNEQSAPRKSSNRLSKPRTNTFQEGGPVQGTIQRQDSQNQLAILPSTTGSSLDLENAVQEAGNAARNKPEGRTRLRDSLLRSMSSDKRNKRRNTVSNFDDLVPLPVEAPPQQWASQSRPSSLVFDCTPPSASPVIGRSRPSTRSRPTSMIYDQRSMSSSMVFELPGDTSFFEEDYNPLQYDGSSPQDNRSSTSLVHQQQQPRLSFVSEQREQSMTRSEIDEWNGQEAAQQAGMKSTRPNQVQRSTSTASIIPPTRRRSMLIPGMATRQNLNDQRQSMINLPPAGTYNSPNDIKGYYFADFSSAAPASLQLGQTAIDEQTLQAYHAGGYKRGSLRITNGNSSPQLSNIRAEDVQSRIDAPQSAHPTNYDRAYEGNNGDHSGENSGDDDKPLTMALVPSSKALVSKPQRPSSRNSGSSRSSPTSHTPPRVGSSTPLSSNSTELEGIETMDLIDFSDNVVIATPTRTSNELALIEMSQKDPPSRSMELAQDYQQLTGTMPESLSTSRSTTPRIDLGESVSAPSTRPVSPAFPLRTVDGSEVPPSPVSPVLTPSNSSSGSTRSTAGTSRTSGSSGTLGRSTEIKPINKMDSPYGSTASLRSLGRANEIRQKESKRVSWSGDFQELPTVPDREAPPMPKLPQQARGQPTSRPNQPDHRRASSGPVAAVPVEQSRAQGQQNAAATRPAFYQNAQSDSRSSLPSMSNEFHNPSPPASPSMARKWSKPRPLSQSIVNAQGSRHTGQPHIPPVPEENSLKIESHMRSAPMNVGRPNNMGRSDSRTTLTTITSMGTEMDEEAREDSAREQSIPERLTSPPMAPSLTRQATAPSHVNSPATSPRPGRVSSPPVSYSGGQPALTRQQTAPFRVVSEPPINAASPPTASLSPPPNSGPLRRSMTTGDMTRPMTSSAYIEMPILRNLSFNNPPPKSKARPTSMFVESTFKIAAKKEEAEKKAEKAEKKEAEKAAKEKSKKLQKEKPRRPTVSRRRTYHEDELAPMSPVEWEQSIGSYDHLGPGLGFSPYDLASPVVPATTSYFEEQPTASPKPRGRATNMDAEAASEFARQKSRLRESSRRRSQSHNRLSLDLTRMSGAGGDPTIRNFTSPVYGEDAPPVPELPNKLRSAMSKKKSPPPVSMSATMRKPVGSGSPRDQNRSAPVSNRSSMNLDDIPQEQIMRPVSSYAHGDQPDTWDPKTRSWVAAANAPMSSNDQLLQNHVRHMSENRRPNTVRTSSSRPVSMFSTSSYSIYERSSPAAESYVNLPELKKAQEKAANLKSKSVENVVIVRSRPNSTRPSLENLRINTGINSGRPSLERLRDSAGNFRANSSRPSLENLRANTYSNSGRTSPVRLSMHQRSKSEHYLPQARSRPVSGDYNQARPRPRPQSQYCSSSRPVSGDFGSGVNSDGGMMVIDRYQGGMQFGYEKGFGLGGSAGTRGPESGASRKSLDESSRYGIDFSDIPMVAF